MLMNPPLHATLARHDRHLQQLVQGRIAFSRQWLKAHAAEDPALAAWLGAQLKPPEDTHLLARLPVTPRLAAEGWPAYYRGDYVEN